MVLHRWKLTALIALGLAVSAGTAQAQGVQTDYGSVSISDGWGYSTYSADSYDDVAGFVPFGGGGWGWIEGEFGERPGSAGNYGNAGFFFPGPRTDTGMWFADLQLMANDEAQAGYDANLGYRWLFGDSFLGVYGALTRDHSEYGYSYNQYGFGGEFARGIFSLNSNVYIPVNESDLNPIAPRVLSNNATVQNSIFGFIDQQLVEQHMRGVDVMARAYVPTQEWLQGGIGYYHYRAPEGDDINGVRFQAGVDLNQVQVNLNVTHDDHFGTSTNVGLAWILGRGHLTPTHCIAPVNRRLFDRVNKQRQVAVQEFQTDVFTPFINPATGRPYTIVYANNTNLDPGDGTLINPYAQLDFANGSNADLIVVQRGDTSPMNKLTAANGLFMTPNQSLVGDGTPFFIDVPGRGSFAVPGLDPMGTNPFVTANNGAAIINIASNTFVDGLNLMPAVNGMAIRGQSLNNFEIRNINNDVMPAMSTGPGAGIVLSNVSGTGIIDNVAFNISNPKAVGGIVVQNSGVGPLDLTINNVPFLLGGRNGVRLAANGSIINASADGVLADMNGTGLELETNGSGEINLAVVDSTFTNAGGGALMIPPGPGVPVPGPGVGFGLLPPDGSEGTGHGINIIANGGEVNLAVTDTDVSTALNDGLHLEGTSFADVNLDFDAVAFTGAGRDGMRLIVDQSDINMMLNDVDLSMVGRNAFNVESSNFANVNGEMDGGVLDAAGVDAFHLLANTDARITLDVSDTSAINPGSFGLWFVGMSNGVFDLNFDNLTMTGTGSDAIFGNLSGMSTAMLSFIDSDLSGAGGNGLRSVLTGGSALTVEMTDTDIANVGADAFDILANNSTAMLLLDGVDASGAGGNGIAAVGVLGSMIGIDTADTDFTGAIVDGINIGLNNSSAMLFADTTLIDTVGGDALRVQANNGSTANVDIADSSLTGAGDNAYDLGFRSGSMIDIRVDGTPSQGAGAEGLLFDGDNAGLVANFINSNLSTLAMGTGGDGVNGRLDNGATANVRLASSAVANAGGDGMDVIADNGSNFIGNVINSPFIDAAGTAFSVAMDNGSNGTLNVNGSPGNGAGGDGLFASADNGSTLSVSLSNGTTFNHVGDDALELFAGTGSTTTLIGDGVTGEMAGDEGIAAFADGGTINVNLTNTGSFIGAGDNGVLLTADAGAINFNMEGSPIANFAMAGNDGFRTTFTNGSTGTINLTDVNFNGAGDDAVELAVTDSTLNTTITNGFLNNATNRGLRVGYEGSTGSLTLDDVWAVNAGGRGIEVEATSGASLDVQMVNGVRFDDAGGSAVFVIANDSTVNMNSSGGISGSNAGDDGIDLFAINGGNLNLSFSDVGDFSGAADDGIDYFVEDMSSANISIFGTMGSPAMFDGAGNVGVEGTAINGSIVNLNLVDTSFSGTGTSDAIRLTSRDSVHNALIVRSDLSNAGNHALRLDYEGSIGSIFVQESNLDDATGSGVSILATMLSSLDVDIIDSSVINAGDDAFTVAMADFSTVDLFVDPTDATGATDNGLEIIGTTGGSLVATFIDSPLSTAANPTGGAGVLATLMGGSTATVNLTRSDVEAVGGAGAIFGTITDGSTFIVNVTDSSLADAAGSAVDIQVDDSTTFVTLTDVDASGAGVDGLALIANNGSTATASLSNVNLNGAGNVALGGAADASTITIIGNNVSGAGAGDAGISLSAANGGSTVLSLTNAGDFSGAGSAGLRVIGTTMSSVTANVSGTMGTPANFGGTFAGVYADVSGMSTATVNLTDVDATMGGFGYVALIDDSTFTSNILRGNFSDNLFDGFVVQVDGSPNTTVNLTDSQVNDAGADAFDLDVINGGVLDMKLTNVSATGAGDDAFDIFQATGGMATIDIDPNDFSGTNGTVFEIDMTGGSMLDLTVADTDMTGVGVHIINASLSGAMTSATLNFTNNDMSGAGNDAVQVDTAGGASFTGNFTNSSMDMAGGNVFDLNAISGSTITVVGDAVSGENSGAASIDLTADDSTINFELANAQDFSTAGGSSVLAFAINNGSSLMIDIENEDPTNALLPRAEFSGAAGAGLRGMLDNGSTLSLNLDGVDFTGNTMSGINIMADNGSTVTGRVAHSLITNNGRGVQLETNNDASIDDTSLIDLDFQFVNVDENNGDGFKLIATNGDDTALMQDTGIIVDFDSGTIRMNDDGIAANGEGDGVDATANGDGTVAGNTRITVNFSGSFNILNEEMNEREVENGMGQVDFLP
ncbi:MAG: inverse autotransporter beta domain-containing protein [Planctomycetaceae bacterium]|nr:inverse autotransporter beta domain-containing protein [Planctomycetaceae bacterium]